MMTLISFLWLGKTFFFFVFILFGLTIGLLGTYPWNSQPLWQSCEIVLSIAGRFHRGYSFWSPQLPALVWTDCSVGLLLSCHQSSYLQPEFSLGQIPCFPILYDPLFWFTHFPVTSRRNIWETHFFSETPFCPHT
jgi:hypothetical protein